MDICVITNDALLARFIVLELIEAGYDAAHGSAADDAKLYIYDLDCEENVPSDAIGFSRDEEKRGLVSAFLQRPIDVAKLRAAVSKLLTKSDDEKISYIEVTHSTRRAKSERGEVRLSAKECSLLEMLCNTPTLSREDAIALFGDGESNVVDVYIHYLRKKLAKVCDGETVCAKRGEGYSLSPSITIKFT